MENFQDRGVWIRSGVGKTIDPDPVCPERLDSDPVYPERLDLDPNPVISDRIRNLGTDNN